eukprot:6056187-Alexandrium_andersonii.AAC.1
MSDLSRKISPPQPLTKKRLGGPARALPTGPTASEHQPAPAAHAETGRDGLQQFQAPPRACLLLH